ncbi:MAG: phytoene/squalene synthase family protein [Sphingobacteriales bacterium]|nr:MAG: phytoene/squalene synthase family protein [Sphingobacteriales bacterium]
MISLFHQVGHQCSKVTTDAYSTSFSSAIRLLHKDIRQPIYDIYGFVRFADEIVDTFHDYDKSILLEEYREDTWKAISNGISLNPILHSFQHVVRKYNIPHELVEAFLHSMEMDLEKAEYHSAEELDEYIYGSAEVVGLMCLCVFCEGDMELYAKLKGPARKLGAAFQKINFLRDIQADYLALSRTYFPGFNFHQFDEESKRKIEEDIRADFDAALEGIRGLPWKAKFGVYTAYKYYNTLFAKICKMQPRKVLKQRVRVPDIQKAFIVLSASCYNKLNLI